MYIIETSNLTKKYKEKYAVKDLSIKIKKGEVFGFLGANGAGKTTTIRMLSTIILPTYGNAKILGYDIKSQAIDVRRNISVIPQNSSLNLHLNSYENIRVYLILKGYSSKVAKKLTDMAIEKYSLQDHAYKMSHQLSGGLRKRVQLARTLVSDANVVFLDEPTTGLDPHSKHLTWEFIRNAKKSGKTIFLTTQSMEEAENLCDRICFMNKGKAIEFADLKTLRDLYGNLSAIIQLGKLTDQQKNDLENANINIYENALQFDQKNNSIETQGLLNISSLISYLYNNDYPVISLNVNDLSLEEIYFKIMEDKIC